MAGLIQNNVWEQLPYSGGTRSIYKRKTNSFVEVDRHTSSTTAVKWHIQYRSSSTSCRLAVVVMGTTICSIIEY